MIRIHSIILVILAFSLVGGGVLVSAQGYTDALLSGPYANNPALQDLQNEIKEKESQLKKVQESSQIYEKRIKEAKTQTASIQSQLSLIDNQITKSELDLKTLQLTTDKSKLEIEAIEFQLQKEQEEIDLQKNRLKEYIKLINKEDQRSLLEILLVNDKFSDFFNQLNYIESIQADLKNSIDRVVLLKDALELKKIELTKYHEQLEASKKELEDKQLKLKEQLIAKESLLFETKMSEVRYQQLLQEARSVQSDVGSSITNIKEQLQRKIATLSSGTKDPLKTFIYWPVDPSRGITTYFNDPTYPFRYLFEHAAIDVRAYQGTPVRAPSDGYVARVRDGGYTNYSYITLIHDNGLSSVYLHMSEIHVKTDDFVKAGEVIGLSGGMPGTRGAGPLTTGPHLHLEVRLNGIPVDPLLYLP